MAQPSFRDIIAATRKGVDLAPVYILMGEESYYIDALVDAFENCVIPADDRDFNQNVFYGNDADLDNVVACAQQFPVMADRKLVLLKEAQSMQQAKAQLEKLAPYVGRPNPTTVFVIAFKGDKLNATSKLLKSAGQSKAVIFKSDPPREWDLPGHVRDYCSSRKFNIDEKATALLCENIGAPLSKLFGEVSKLIQIKGEDKRITAEDIEKHIGISKDYNNLELSNAVAKKDYPKAMRILKYFKKNPKACPSPVITATLFGLFQKYTIYYYLPDRSDKTVQDALGVKSSFALRNLKEGLRNYNASQAVNAIHALREFDTKSKGVGSYQNEYDLLGEMLFKIFTA